MGYANDERPLGTALASMQLLSCSFPDKHSVQRFGSPHERHPARVTSPPSQCPFYYALKPRPRSSFGLGRVISTPRATLVTYLL
ncbi:hypothetical protein BD310DRAFT_930389 [Dichomitus squalens]|uniref:Uncharacterized protein n=1 Tax=Dichomitus squalens TaxID=114155 RepID=A0A4Q9PRR4_9APHY|nr:hypothetical protein BD310DRAFT_930389 [Dichomitus squalens]